MVRFGRSFRLFPFKRADFFRVRSAALSGLRSTQSMNALSSALARFAMRFRWLAMPLKRSNAAARASSAAKSRA
jgi:hypothetical protein